MKKPRKKYRPKPVRMTATILDAVMGDITDDEIARIYELAEEGLDLLQIGSKDVMAFHKMDAAVRAAFTLAEAFEHKYDIQALCVLATGALIMASTWNENQDQPIKEKLVHGLTDADVRQCIAASLEPVQAVLDLWRDMVKQAKRSEVLRAMEAANRFYINIPLSNIAITEDGGFEPPKSDSFMRERGIAWIHGQCRSGFLDYDGRLIWRMPQTKSQVRLDRPTLLVLIPSGQKYDFKELICQMR